MCAAHNSSISQKHQTLIVGVSKASHGHLRRNRNNCARQTAPRLREQTRATEQKRFSGADNKFNSSSTTTWLKSSAARRSRSKRLVKCHYKSSGLYCSLHTHTHSAITQCGLITCCYFFSCWTCRRRRVVLVPSASVFMLLCARGLLIVRLNALATMSTANCTNE